jgi:hypothetical protein
MIVWLLDLQLPMQSVPTITNVVRSNTAHGEVCLIQHYVIKSVSDLRQIGGLLRFHPKKNQKNLPATIKLKCFKKTYSEKKKR